MTLAERSATIGVLRKGGKKLHWFMIVLNVCFGFLIFCYGFLYWFDQAFFSVVKENVLADIPNGWVVWIFLLPTSFLACWDLRNMGNIFMVFTGNECWIIGMAVVVFFDLIDKMEDETESRKYLLLGFIVIGFVITFISINFIRDGTGLTGGTIIAVAKVHNTYFFSKDKKVSQAQWFLVYLLSITSLLCKLSEGSGTNDAAAQTSAPSSPSIADSSQQYYSMYSSGESTPKITKGNGKKGKGKGNSSKGNYNPKGAHQA